MIKSKFRELFVYFLKLGAEHVHVSAHKVATECDVEPVSLFSLDARTRSASDLGRLACIFRFARLHRSAVSKPAFLGPVLLSINCH
jgi:hypothetical protein